MVAVKVGSSMSRGGGSSNAIPPWGGGDSETGPRVGGEEVGRRVN